MSTGDMSPMLFRDALHAIGFCQPAPGAPWFERLDEPGKLYGGVLDAKTFHIDHVATLERLEKENALRGLRVRL